MTIPLRDTKNDIYLPPATKNIAKFSIGVNFG